MRFLLDGLHDAWQLIISGDPSLIFVTRITVQVAVVSTFWAVVIGLPIALALGIGSFRGRTLLTIFANAGLGLPPVAVGLILSVLMLPAGPLGSLHLLNTVRGIYVAQAVLALPIVVAFGASAIRELPPGLLDQARAFGAGRWRLWVLALREARIGIFAAVIAAAGSALSEVGAVILVGGNSIGFTQTLASAALTRYDGGDISGALAIGMILLALILIITALLTWLQFGRRTRARVRAS